ncbi:IS982 family transposase [bacterium]|nr:IS982 family transposase [bacterium]
MDVEELFCKADDFYRAFEPKMRARLIGTDRRGDRCPGLSSSEMITILILFHQSHYRHFKGFYLGQVCRNMRSGFPELVSYSRFIQLLGRILVPVEAFLNAIKGEVSGISFVDSTALTVCHNKRINRHKVFDGLATRGKTTTGWFFGFKLHLIVNECGDILSWSVTQGQVDDRRPVPHLARHVKGKLFGDKGYISQPLFNALFEQGTQLITSVRSNMKAKFMPIMDRILVRKRFIIETIMDQLKNISQIEHSRHQSPVNFLINLVAALSPYQLKPKKPSLDIHPNQLALIF